MNQDEIKMITWRIDRDQFILDDKDRLDYPDKKLHDAQTQGFINGLKWVRDGDMHKCIADNKTPLERGELCEDGQPNCDCLTNLESDT